MSVSDPTDPSIINCTVIQQYTQSSSLEVAMVTQLTVGILSMLSIILTLNKVFTSVMIDRAFKEYLLTCFAVQFSQCCALALLQAVLLTTYLTSAQCEAFIPARLCHWLRITATTISTLPFLNVALTLFRFFVLYRKHDSSLREFLWLFRGLQCKALVLCIGIQFYKYYDVNMDGYVVYCTGNFKGVADKLRLESIIMAGCEAFSIMFSGCLFRSYKKSDRTFEVNGTLLRRQTIQTFHMFIWFSLIQTTTFLGFLLVGGLYRTSFANLGEPLYSTGSTLLFIPMYYTMFSPWLIYFILKREETKRVKGTKDLLARENNGTAEYFAMTERQWAYPSTTKNEQTTNIDRLVRFIRMTRNVVPPARKSCW